MFIQKGAIIVDNISKIMHYIQRVSKLPILVDGVECWEEPLRIKLGETLFDTDPCHCCGNCCIPESNVFTQSEYDKIMNMTEEEFRAEGYIFDERGFDPSYLVKLKSKIREEKHIVNDKEISFYIYDREPNNMYLPNKTTENKYRDRCVWMILDDDGLYKCHIHPVRSVTCDMPHIRFDWNSKSKMLTITTRQYGRNWALGCPAIFEPPKDEAQFNDIKKDRLRKFDHLKQCTEDLGIDINTTYLPEIISYLEPLTFDNYRSKLGFDILHEHIVASKSKPAAKKPVFKPRKLF